MAQKEAQPHKAAVEAGVPIFNFAKLGETGKQQIEAIAAAQHELFGWLQETNQYWFARAKSEAELNSDLITRLTSAHSIPETATACREWANRRMDMTVEDGQRMFADSLTLAEKAGQFFSNGAVANRP